MARKLSRYMSLEERLWCRVDRNGPSGCWVWIGPPGNKGYGKLRRNGRTVEAHRVAYELVIGPVPDGLTIDHLCRNRACVNPAHLEAVPFRVNVMRGEGCHAKNARKTHCVRGHELTPENIYPGKQNRVCIWCARSQGSKYYYAHRAEILARMKRDRAVANSCRDRINECSKPLY